MQVACDKFLAFPFFWCVCLFSAHKTLEMLSPPGQRGPGDEKGQISWRDELTALKIAAELL